jgi:XTP/dITP diphosphohydrolase
MKTKRFVMASSNSGKLAEIRRMLHGSPIDVVPQSNWDVVDVDETGGTFVENAILKAREAARLSGLPALADDSGLEVDALDGAPGVRSARFAGDECDDAANNRLLLRRLSDVPAAKRSARFRCVMVCMRHPDDPAPLICQGTWEGAIAQSASGEGGFGYDPLFVPAGQDRTAAELNADEKNSLSHRGQALRALTEFLRDQQ